jgi:hypothetical protein
MSADNGQSNKTTLIIGPEISPDHCRDSSRRTGEPVLELGNGQDEGRALLTRQGDLSLPRGLTAAMWCCPCGNPAGDPVPSRKSATRWSRNEAAGSSELAQSKANELEKQVNR